MHRLAALIFLIICMNDVSSVAISSEDQVHDRIFERLISQIWQNYQVKLNGNGQLYGETIDPLDVSSQLPKFNPMHIKRKGTGYSLDAKMGDIKMYGLGQIHLMESTVTRNENLTDMNVTVTIGFPKLVLNGSYAIKGKMGYFIPLNYNGPFAVTIVNASVTHHMELKLADKDSNDLSSCQKSSRGNVLITNIKMPLRYADIKFKFANLGKVTSFVVKVMTKIWLYFNRSNEKMIVGKIREVIKKEVSSLMC